MQCLQQRGFWCFLGQVTRETECDSYGSVYGRRGWSNDTTVETLTSLDGDTLRIDVDLDREHVLSARDWDDWEGEAEDDDDDHDYYGNSLKTYNYAATVS